MNSHSTLSTGRIQAKKIAPKAEQRLQGTDLKTPNYFEKSSPL